VFGEDRNKSEAQSRRDQEWVKAKDSRIRKQKAWNILFSDMTLEKIVQDMNRIWLDPDYELVIVPDRVRRVTIGAK